MVTLLPIFRLEGHLNTIGGVHADIVEQSFINNNLIIEIRFSIEQ